VNTPAPSGEALGAKSSAVTDGAKLCPVVKKAPSFRRGRRKASAVTDGAKLCPGQGGSVDQFMG